MNHWIIGSFEIDSAYKNKLISALESQHLPAPGDAVSADGLLLEGPVARLVAPRVAAVVVPHPVAVLHADPGSLFSSAVRFRVSIYLQFDCEGVIWAEIIVKCTALFIHSFAMFGHVFL